MSSESAFEVGASSPIAETCSTAETLPRPESSPSREDDERSGPSCRASLDDSPAPADGCAALRLLPEDGDGAGPFSPQEESDAEWRQFLGFMKRRFPGRIGSDAGEREVVEFLKGKVRRLVEPRDTPPGGETL